jgi:hypothetical protein
MGSESTPQHPERYWRCSAGAAGVASEAHATRTINQAFWGFVMQPGLLRRRNRCGFDADCHHVRVTVH